MRGKMRCEKCELEWAKPTKPMILASSLSGTTVAEVGNEAVFMAWSFKGVKRKRLNLWILQSIH
jgi:hypothetical protein